MGVLLHNYTKAWCYHPPFPLHHRTMPMRDENMSVKSCKPDLEAGIWPTECADAWAAGESREYEEEGGGYATASVYEGGGLL